MITVQMMVHSVTKTLTFSDLGDGLTPRQKKKQRFFFYADEQTSHVTHAAWPEAILDLLCARVNHHLNMAYTVYHGASSAASLSLCFLPVPPPVSSLIVFLFYS